MKKYKAYIKQEGGCDYTIECGAKLVDLGEAEGLNEAMFKFRKIIEEDHNHIETKIDSAVILEVTLLYIVDVKKFYNMIESDKMAQEEKIAEDLEKAEFERLKKKFGHV